MPDPGRMHAGIVIAVLVDDGIRVKDHQILSLIHIFVQGLKASPCLGLRGGTDGVEFVGMIAQESGPVSYTHLDVYKRQASHRAAARRGRL